MTSVLVTDGDERAALAVVRSLGRAGFDIHVCGSHRRTLAALSRRTLEAFAVPDPLRAPTEFVRAVAAYVTARRVDIVVPVTEAALLAVLARREAFGAAVIPFPPLERFRAASDKIELGEIARLVGIASPDHVRLNSAADVAALDAGALPYPVVLKPARSIGEMEGRRSKHTVRHARDAAELTSRIAELSPAAFPVLVQRRIVGGGCGVFLLRWNGATAAWFAHRRILEKPPAGGVSVYAEAVMPSPALLAQSERLLEALDWQGVAMVEYKIDATTGVPYLMEVNGRFWGSLQLAIDAGVDFPKLLVLAALGEQLPLTSPYRSGAKGRWWWGEVDHVLTRLRHSDAELALPPGSPSRGAAVRQFLTRWNPRERDAVLRLNDPLPFLYESVRWLTRH